MIDSDRALGRLLRLVGRLRTPSAVDTRRFVVAALLIAATAGGVAGAGSSSETPTNETVPPGAYVSSSIVAQEAQVTSTYRTALLRVDLERADSPTERAHVRRAHLAALERDAMTVSDRWNRTHHEFRTGTLPSSVYRVKLTATAARAKAIRRLARRSAGNNADSDRLDQIVRELPDPDEKTWHDSGASESGPAEDGSHSPEARSGANGETPNTETEPDSWIFDGRSESDWPAGEHPRNASDWSDHAGDDGPNWSDHAGDDGPNWSDHAGDDGSNWSDGGDEEWHESSDSEGAPKNRTGSFHPWFTDDSDSGWARDDNSGAPDRRDTTPEEGEAVNDSEDATEEGATSPDETDQPPSDDSSGGEYSASESPWSRNDSRSEPAASPAWTDPGEDPDNSTEGDGDDTDDDSSDSDFQESTGDDSEESDFQESTGDDSDEFDFQDNDSADEFSGDPPVGALRPGPDDSTNQTHSSRSI